MRISDAEVKKVLSDPSQVLVEAIVEIGHSKAKEEDHAMVQGLTASIVSMPDREEMIAELQAKIKAGTYHISADAIVDGMVRRAVADSLR